MDNNIRPFQGELHNWKQIASIKAGDKFIVKNHGPLGHGTVEITHAGAMQSVFRGAVNKLTSSLADADSTINWLVGLQKKTGHDIQAIKTNPVNNPLTVKELEQTIDQLNQMKTALKGANQALDHLAQTYSSRPDISKTKDQALNVDQSIQDRKNVNDALIIEINEKIHDLVNNYAEIHTSSPQDMTKANTAKKGIVQVNDYVKGVGVDNKLVDFKAADGRIIQVPDQFRRDFHRLPHVELNNEVIYSAHHQDMYDVGEAYEKLNEAVGSGLKTLLPLLTQGMFADTIVKTQLEYMEKGEFRALTDKIEPFHTIVNTSKDQVKITLKNLYAIRDADDIEGKKKNPIEVKYQLQKREFTLSLQELQQYDGHANLLTKVDVKDTYSPEFSSKETAIAAYHNF